MTGLHPGRTVTFIMEDGSERAAVITEVVSYEPPVCHLEVWLRPSEQQYAIAVDPDTKEDMLIYYMKTSTRMHVRHDSMHRVDTFHLPGA